MALGNPLTAGRITQPASGWLLVLSPAAAPELHPPCPLLDLILETPTPHRPSLPALFRSSPSEVPSPPPSLQQRDGASQERACHVNSPLFFITLKMDCLPSNFCGTMYEGAHYVKHIFSPPPKLHKAMLGGFGAATHSIRMQTPPQPAACRLAHHCAIQHLQRSLKYKLVHLIPAQGECGCSSSLLLELSLQSACTCI